MAKFEKKRPDFLTQRRKEILGEYRFHNLEPVRIGREPISMELALQLGLIVDLTQTPADQQQQAAE